MPTYLDTSSGSALPNSRVTSRIHGGHDGQELSGHAVKTDCEASTVGSQFVGRIRENAFMRDDFTSWQVLCMCCGIQGRALANPRAPGELPTSWTICKPCAKHQGSERRDLEKRNTEHVVFWRSYLTEEVAKLNALHERELATLAGIIRQKDQELEDRPIQVIHENLDQEAVDSALAERDIAWQHRDSALGSLSQFKAWHRDKGDGNCWCSLSLAKCKVRKLLSNDQTLTRWERKQLERYKRGESHSLPWAHPALSDPHWVVEG